MWEKIKKKIEKSSNKLNIAKISSGTLLGQGISIITLPIITRLYGAEILGIWTLLNSISVIIYSFSDWGLTNSLMVEDDNNEEKNYKVVSSISALSCFIASSFTILYIFFFNSDIKINLIFIYLYLIITTFTSQQIQICYTWLNRKGKYNILMKNPLINNGVYSFLAIMLGIIGYKSYGYFIAYIFGQIITLLHMKRNLPNIMFTFNIKDYSYILKKNKSFVIYQVPINIVSKMKSQLPTFVIRGFWGIEILGYYSVAIKVLNIPTTLLASAIGRVFFKTISLMKRNGELIGSYVYKNMISAMQIAIVPIAILNAFGDLVTVLFFGEEWIIAGKFIQILGMQYLYIFITNSVQGLAITLDKQKYNIVSIISELAAGIISLYIGKYIFNNIYMGLGIMTTFTIIINIIYFSALYKIMGIEWKQYVRKVFLCTAFTLCLSGILRLIYTFVFI